MLLEDFQKEADTCNLVAAAQMAALCCMVYEGDQEAIRALLEPEGELLFFHEARETWRPGCAVMRSGPNRFFVVSEGTISFTQALAQGSPLNLLCPVTDNESTERDFYGLFYYQVYQELRALIEQYVPFSSPDLRLFLSGHSMGGAVAQVAAYEFARNIDAARVQLLTIGAPKAAAGVWDYPVPAVHWRVESSGDPVTTYPVAAIQWFLNKVTLKMSANLLSTGWQHYGRDLVLTRTGTDDPWAFPFVPKEPGLALDELGQHFLENYLARIKLRAQFVYAS